MKYNNSILLLITLFFGLSNVASAKFYCAEKNMGCFKNNHIMASGGGSIEVQNIESARQKNNYYKRLQILLSLTPNDMQKHRGNNQSISRKLPVEGLMVKKVDFDFNASREVPTQKATNPKKAKTNSDPKFLFRAGKRALDMENYPEAKKYFKELLSILEAKGEESLELANALHEMGRLHLNLGAYGKAAPLFLRSLSLKEKKLSLEHPSVASTRAKLGDLYKAQGAFGKAEKFYLRALSIYEKHSGLEEKTVAEIKMNMGDIYFSKKQYVKAEKFYFKATAIYKKVLHGSNHPIIVRIDAKLAEIYAQNGDLRKAEDFYLDAIVKSKKVLGPEHASVARAMKKLADFYQNNKHYKNAEKNYLLTLSVATKAFGRDHPFVAEVRKSLSDVYESLGQHQKADSFRKKSMQIYG